MKFRSRIAGIGLAILCLSAFAAGQGPVAAPLTKEEIANAARTDALSVPTPGELLAALNKLGKLDWSARFRPPIATSFTSRPQMALNLGGLIADGYIAVEAQDAQQVKNIGKDIVALAKPLGVQQNIIDRGKSLTDFASENQWETLKEELEATQNEVKDAMAENKDQNLVTLVTVGGWLRGTEAITSYISEKYSESGAKLLRQPAIVKFLSERLDALPDKVRDDPVVKQTRVTLLEIESAINFPATATPTVEDVKKVNTLAVELLKDLARREPK